MQIPPSHADAVKLYGPLMDEDPAAVYHEIRRVHGAVAPVLLDGDMPAWYVSSYRDVHHVLSNPALFGRDARRWNLYDQIPPDWPLAPFGSWGPSVLHTEGDEHQRRAGAIGDALDAVSRTELGRICEQTADQLIDSFSTGGEADLIGQYAQQIPIRVITRLYGIPEDEIPSLIADTEAAATETAGALEAHMRVIGRIGQLIAERRQNPGTGLPARMVTHPARLTDDELTHDMHIVLMGAQQPTADWIGNTLRLMLADEEFALTLQGGRGSADQALNEVLWKDTPVQNLIGRYAISACGLGGRQIEKGDLVVLGLAAANADPQVRPDSFGDVQVNRAHMSFAQGEHSCPFAAPELAEIIARTAIEVLLDRLPDVTLAVPLEEIKWRPAAWVRGLYSLPVTFTPVTHTTRYSHALW
jgi:cytochrome P450